MATDVQVSGVQCKFVQQMLNFSNFSKHLSAVRETNAIVKRAVDLSSADHGAAMAVIKKWLHRQNIVGQLLRTNLHQKQYVDQVSARKAVSWHAVRQHCICCPALRAFVVWTCA